MDKVRATTRIIGGVVAVVYLLYRDPALAIACLAIADLASWFHTRRS